MIWLITLAFTILSAFVYRVGGMSRNEAYEKIPWFPQILVKGWVRDIGCLILVGIWCLMFVDVTHTIWRWLAFAITFKLAISTYWDWTGKDNFFLHGLGIGLSLLFISLSWQVGLYTILLSLSMGIISVLSSDVDVEEYSRGAFIVMWLPMLLMGG